MTEYHSITPIPNLFIDSNLQIADFEVFRNLSKEELEENHDIDFGTMNYIQKNTWVSSPIYIRNFKLEGNNDDLENAYKTANKHISHFINALVLFQPSITYIDRGPLWVYPIPKPENGESGKGDFYGILEVRGNEKLDLDNSEFTEFATFFGTCYSYFSKETKTDLDQSIDNAYYWLMKTRATVNPYDRLIFLTVLLESLVGAGQELTHRISHRCGTILGKDAKERGEIYDEVRDYYGQRSTILHGNRESITNNGLHHLAEIGRTIILRFSSLSKTNYANNRVEFLKKLDRAVVDDDLRKEIIDKARELFKSRSDPQFQ